MSSYMCPDCGEIVDEDNTEEIGMSLLSQWQIYVWRYLDDLFKRSIR